jgi:hypothetical protein
MSIIAAIKRFFATIFISDPKEKARRLGLKQVYAKLALTRPVFYRPSQNQVLTGFAQSLFTYTSLLRPIRDIILRTIGTQDVRLSQKFFDILVDDRLSPETREKKALFTYDGMKARLDASFNLSEDSSRLNRDFQSFMKTLDSPALVRADRELRDIEGLVDICRHDYDRLLGLFDPGIDSENQNYRPEFSPVPAEMALPELLDLFYITANFSISPQMEEDVAILLERISPPGVDPAAQRRKLQKCVNAVNKILDLQLNAENLTALIQALKDDPSFQPEAAHSRASFLDAYKARLSNQFKTDHERILREKHENALGEEIIALFGDMPIIEVGGYNDENSELLARESPNSFTYVKPLRLFKTFAYSIFDTAIKDQIKRLLVEGYFDNKAFQNNLANVFYQCERAPERVMAFEQQISGSGRVSLVTLRRYIEEAKHGRDVTGYIDKMADAINLAAREIIEDGTNLFGMLSDSLADLLNDIKKPQPELVTNIRTLGGNRNRELMQDLADACRKIHDFAQIMRNFTLVKNTGTIVEGVGAP